MASCTARRSPSAPWSSWSWRAARAGRSARSWIFCLSVGLPVCLADLGIVKPTRADIRHVAEAATAPNETIHATWFEVTADKVEAAIWAANALAIDYRARRESRGPSRD